MRNPINSYSTVGEFLLQEFLNPLTFSEEEFALYIGVPVDIINKIINNELPIDNELDKKLVDYFGVSNGFFLRVQQQIATWQKKE